MTESAQSTWLTQDAYDRLAEELAYLEGPGRAVITERIAAARDEGDLKENGGYHAAREEQAKQEARIRQLKVKLRDAQIGTPVDTGIVAPGMLVTVEIAGDDMEFLLGSREVAGTSDVDVYSPTSPLGEAILGKAVGDSASYVAPNGKTFDVVVKAAKPFVG